MKVIFPEANIPDNSDTRKYKLAVNDFIKVQVKTKIERWPLS